MKKSPKQPVGFRFSPIMVETLKELATDNSIIKNGHYETQTDWLMFVLAKYIKIRLGEDELAPKEDIENCFTPNDVFELFCQLSKNLKREKMRKI